MPQMTTRSAVVTTRTTQHDLSIHGLAGIAMFILLFTLMTFIIAFATAGWSGNVNDHNGLWSSCRSYGGRNQDFHIATQVLMCLALLGLAVALILIFLYLFSARVSKYQVLLGLVIDSFITFALLLIAVIVYGAGQRHNLYWSYVVAIISTVLCFIAAVLSAIQLSRC